ncbi:hypothetical protein K7V76_003159 [Vibrio fluvialis]|nr:hypothetical protein [Vibrio fluvialis]EKO3527578.1 hypothetical protein [Vibrio fluvialis]ELP3312384.1 hypothetical protein [Vibrio fluvialis]
MIEQFLSDYQSQIEALQWWHVALGYLFVSFVDSLVDNRLNAMKEKAIAEVEREQSKISDAISWKLLYLLLDTIDYSWPVVGGYSERSAYRDAILMANKYRRASYE